MSEFWKVARDRSGEGWIFQFLGALYLLVVVFLLSRLSHIPVLGTLLYAAGVLMIGLLWFLAFGAALYAIGLAIAVFAKVPGASWDTFVL